MAIINWERVHAFMGVYKWKYVDLAREMGVSSVHVSDVLHNKRKASIDFIDLLVDAVRARGYDEILIHPNQTMAKMSSREKMGMLNLSDGRKWPVRFGRDYDRDAYASPFSQLKQEREVAAKKFSDSDVKK